MNPEKSCQTLLALLIYKNIYFSPLKTSTNICSPFKEEGLQALNGDGNAPNN